MTIRPVHVFACIGVAQLILGLLTACTNAPDATRILAENGYTDIRVQPLR